MRDRFPDGLIRLSLLVFPVLVLVSPFTAKAQHAAGHEEYQHWSSTKAKDCCDQRHCKDLDEKEWRHTKVGTIEIQILGKWCPVRPDHFVIKGKSPNWTKAHACINSDAMYFDPCDALLCFMDLPKT